MAADSLRSTIDAISRRLQDELEAQLSELSARHQDELESARRAAELEAEQRWSAKVDEVRAEWTARLESEVTSARAEAERRMVAEAMRLRVEAEQAAAETAARARQELEDSLSLERSRAATELESARGLLSTERDTVRQELEAARREIEEAGRQLQAARDERAALENVARDERAALENAAREERAALENAAREEREALENAAREEREARQALDKALREERAALENDLRRQIAAIEEHLIQQRSALEDEAHRRVAAAEDEGHRQLSSIQEQVARAAAAREQAEAALARERREREDDVREQAQRVEAAAEARLAERQVQLAVVERILTAVRSLDNARSLSQVLSALLTSAAAEAPRVALFVTNGAELKGWKAEGFGMDAAALQVNGTEDGLFADVLQRGEPAVTSDGGAAAPGFANLPADRAAIAVPLLVGAQPVAVLYADDAGDGPQQVPASWPEAIQILCRHASVNLAHLTAARAVETMRRSLVPPAPAGVSRRASGHRAPALGPSGSEDSNSARRYARLLVSEIKLYNEPAVRLGREKRDLLARLKPEIARARRLYEQRISTAIDSRGALFQQELVQTLADGDPALLGGSA